MTTMTFRKYIEEVYDVRERIEHLQSNPIKDFINSDIFPCDYVAIEQGEMIKMLYYDNGRKEIAVLDLLSYTREDLVKIKDKELLELYDTYTEQFDFDNSFDLNKLKELRESNLIRNAQLGI